MHNALAPIVEAEQGHASFTRVNLKVLDHGAAVRLVDRRQPATRRRYIMIRRGERSIRPAYGQIPLPEHTKRIAGSIVDQMTINVKERRAILARLDRMR
jgi:hypothetical protein